MKTLKPAPKPGPNTKTTTKPKRRASRGRTSRACDRCRAKKAKCDGDQACKLCRATDSRCVYSARRREARNYYYQMREVTDVALQRLYWACRRRTGFPGDIPDESKGEVSTTDILKGLGLLRPDLDEPNVPGELEQSIHISNNNGRARRPPQTMSPRAEPEPEGAERQSVASPGSTSSSPQSSDERAVTTSTSYTNTNTNTSLPLEPEVAMPSGEMDMKTQFELASSLSPVPPTSSTLSRKRAFSHDEHPFWQEQVVEPQLDVDAFVDMSLCTSPTPQMAPPFYAQSMTFSMPAVTTLAQAPYGQVRQLPHGLLYDGYSSP